jgi:hypothetical protein
MLMYYENINIFEIGGLYVMGIFVSKTIGLDVSVTNYVNSYNYISSICRPIYFLENGADELFVGK